MTCSIFRNAPSIPLRRLLACLCMAALPAMQALRAEAFVYDELRIEESSIIQQQGKAGRLAFRFMNVQLDDSRVMAELGVTLVIPLDRPRLATLHLSMSEPASRDQTFTGIRRNTHLGGSDNMGETIRTQMARVPDIAIVASLCETLLSSAFRARLLGEAAARDWDSEAALLWRSIKSQDAINGIAGHCLYAAHRGGVPFRNPLIHAGMRASPTQAAAHASRDFSVGVGSTLFTNHVDPGTDSHATNTTVTLMGVSVEGRAVGDGTVSFGWEGDLRSRIESTVYHATGSDTAARKGPGVTEGTEDLVLNRSGSTTRTTREVLAATGTQRLLLLKHLIESETAMRQGALASHASIARGAEFTEFWEAIAPTISRDAVLAQISAELARRFRRSEADLRALQTALAGLGLYSAEIDGEAGPAMRDAIKAFEASIGTLPDGYLTIWETALLRPELLEPERGSPETEALRAERKRQADAIRAAAPPRAGGPAPAQLALAEIAMLEAQKAELAVLKQQLRTAEMQLRQTKNDLNTRLDESGRDLAQCLCDGEIGCLDLEVELP